MFYFTSILLGKRLFSNSSKLLLLSAVSTLSLQTSSAAFESYLDIGSLDTAYSYAYDISANGLVVVGETSVSGAPLAQAFAWSLGSSMSSLLTTPTQTVPFTGYSSARGVNADGSVIVGAVEIGGTVPSTRAFAWTPLSGMFVLTPTTIGSPSVLDVAEDVNASGRFVAGYSQYGLIGPPSATGITAVLWDLTAPTVAPLVLGDLDGAANDNLTNNFSRAYAISDGGLAISDVTVVGDSWNPADETEAFMWTQGTGMVGLGNLGFVNFGTTIDFGSTAHGVSESGQFIVGQAADSTTDRAGFIFDVMASTMYELNEAAGDDTANALAVSADGTRIVGYSGISGAGLQAAIWDVDTTNLSTDPRTAVLLADVLAANGVDMTGIVLRQATGISADGSVVTGFGNFGDGTEAFITSENALATVSDLIDSARGPGYLTSQASALLNEFNNDLMTVARHYDCSAMGANYEGLAKDYCLFARGGAELGLSGITADRMTGSFGVVFPHSEKLRWGLAAGVGYSTIDDLSQGSSVDMVIGELGVFADYRANELTGLRASTVLSAGIATAEIDRGIRNGGTLQSYDGNSSGAQLLAKARAGYGFIAYENQLRLEPYVGVAVGYSSFDGYTESNSGALQASFGDQVLKYYGLSAGITVDYEHSERIKFFGDYSVTYDEGSYTGLEINIDRLAVDASTGSVNDSGVRGRLQLGVGYKLTEKIQLNADVEHHHHIHGENSNFSVGGMKVGMIARF